MEKIKLKTKFVFLYVVVSFVLLFIFPYSYVSSDTATDLKNKIDDRTSQIKKLEEEIKQYNQEVTNVNSQAKTLQTTIKSLDLTKKKITTDLTLTEKKINRAELTIDQLAFAISSTTNQIDRNKKVIGLLLRNSQDLEESNLFATLLGGKNITDIWDDIENIRQVHNQIRIKSEELRGLKTDLEDKQAQMTGQKTQLVSLKQDLSGKKQAVESTQQEKSQLLAQTKNKEQVFKNLIKDREQQKAQFEKELYEFESQLNIAVDKGSYPAPRNGVLSWPLEDVYITQRFGKTVGAEKLYASGSHNGVDFRATIGTKVMTALDGVVAGTGNTDIYPGCYSFGKWVMVKHPNGLSTIYGHLSSISVTTGAQIKKGDTIGYSGNTGYSTGPHLHLGLYATQGVRIEQYVNSKGCKQATIPLADIKAYLDPMAYLPEY
ncbi:MAG: Peptidase, family [Patescibacteria group bacterium]|nr:Peptidase, family [Patescibacteria group bacterium]